jgi:uncharacterized protein (DUF1778 family)
MKEKGRPKLPKAMARGSILSLRLQPSERRRLDEAAEKADMKITEWARKRLLESAERDIS